MSSPREDSPPRDGSIPSGSPPLMSPVLGSSSLSSLPMTVSQLPDNSPALPPTTELVSSSISRDPALPARPRNPVSKFPETSAAPTTAQLYESSPPRSPRPREAILQGVRSPHALPRKPAPASIGGGGGSAHAAAPADPNEAALLRRLIRIHGPSEWSDEVTAHWERETPNEALRPLAMAVCEMSEEELVAELLQMIEADVEEIQLRRLIEANGLSQPQIDYWVRHNPGMGLRTLTMMATGMTSGEIEVELGEMGREKREGRYGGAAVEDGEMRIETTKGGAGGTDAKRQPGFGDRQIDVWLRCAREKGKNVDGEVKEAVRETSTPTMRKSTDEEDAEEVQQEEHEGAVEALNQEAGAGPDGTQHRVRCDDQPGSGSGDKRFLDLDGPGNTKEVPESDFEDFAEGVDTLHEDSIEHTTPTETTDMITSDEALASMVLEATFTEEVNYEEVLRTMEGRPDREVAVDLRRWNGAQEEVVQPADGPVIATWVDGGLVSVATEHQQTRSERRAARRVVAEQMNTPLSTPFQIVSRRGALSQRGCSKPTRFPKKSEPDTEQSPALNLPNHNGAFRGRGQGARDSARGNRRLVESTRGGARPLRADGQTDREFMGHRGGFNERGISQKGGKQGGEGKRG